MQTSPSPAAASATDGGATPFSAVEAITTTHLILIAALAVIVVIGMIYGARLKRRRTAALEEEQERLDAYEGEHPDAPPAEASPRRPVAPAEPVTTASGQEEQRAPVATPPTPPHDPADQQIPPASAAGSGSGVQTQSQVQRQSAPAPSAAPAGAPADGPVTQLKGLGPKVATRLAELGITSVGQIAALDNDAADALDARLGAFRGRIARDRWVEQARFLAAGDVAGFEAVFGRL